MSLRSVTPWLLCAAAMLLHGCAILTSPGYDFTDPEMSSSAVESDLGNPDRAPQGRITPITPTLVQAMRATRPTSIGAEVEGLFAEPTPYTIGPGDIVSVVVYDHPELQPQGTSIIQSGDPTSVTGAPGFIVDKDGMIFFPYVRRVKVGGLTEAEAAELVESRIRRVIKDPQVTVRIASFRSRRAYVEGEVRSPGTQVFTDLPMTLNEALNRAGGITLAGDRSFVTLSRKGTTTPINLVRMQELGINPSRILLQDGDMLLVHHREDSKVFVMGEIARPSAMTMRNGKLTLNEALGEAGGPNLGTANTGQIYVIRNVVGQETPAIYHLNASSPVALALADNFDLLPRDVVYVDAVPLVHWNRIISLILPSAQAVGTGRSLVNP